MSSGADIQMPENENGSVESSPHCPISVPIVSTSLDPQSQSRFLAFNAARRLEGRGVSVELVDPRQTPLPAFENAEANESVGQHALGRSWNANPNAEGYTPSSLLFMIVMLKQGQVSSSVVRFALRVWLVRWTHLVGQH
ncbi:NADPH-dependent FMN reductase [Arthrobacter castelli]|uniref:NADPH-dependent FMN reductase n=1 Tax=Arthrobacter castelli TaxID=271431 RepID=UPI0012DCE2F1|nr:hypothetical protein [Arthrobacter castelli]